MIYKLKQALMCLILLFSLSFNFSSCIRTSYMFINDESEIVSVEIVECDYTIVDEKIFPSSKLLATIDDIELFMKDFNKISYRLPLLAGDPERFDFCEIAIKFNFKNGDYQLVGNTAKSTRYKFDENVSTIYCVVGFFNEKQYEDLMAKYMSLCNDPKFYFLNSQDMIDSIEIVDVCVDDSDNKFNIVSKIDDIDSFINKIKNLPYNYALHKSEFIARKDKENHQGVVKINYNNGDYELIDDCWRNVYIKHTDEYIYNAYIGEFNKDDFDLLLSEEL